MEQELISFDSGDGGDDTELDLASYAQRAYLEYALSVVKGRALPDVCDGQKPVQRRILYSMSRMGLGFTGAAGARPVKSARVVGDVLGRFHPHGDQAAYDALVRMAQDFSQRYPLIDGHGNFGSRDGDGAAAMRYTEARLARITNLLLDEIDEGTVAFIPNYDGSTAGAAATAGAPAVHAAQRRERHRRGPGHRDSQPQPARGRRRLRGADQERQARRRRTVRAAAGSGLSRRRPDHQRRGRHRRGLSHRPRFAQGAGALEDRGTGARPVAAGGERTAAGRQHAEGAGRNRGTDQPEGQGRQEGAEPGAGAAQADRAGGARHGARRVEQGRGGAPGVRAQDQPHRTVGADHHAAGAHQPGNLVADQPHLDRPGRQAGAEVAAPDAAGVDRVPPGHHRAALAAPAGQGRWTASTSSRAGSWCC